MTVNHARNRITDNSPMQVLRYPPAAMTQKPPSIDESSKTDELLTIDEVDTHLDNEADIHSE
jgi:hypothetical protein